MTRALTSRGSVGLLEAVVSLKVRRFNMLVALCRAALFSIQAVAGTGVFPLAVGDAKSADPVPFCAVESPPSRGFHALSTTAPIPAVGEKKVLYFRLCYPDDPVEPISEQAAKQLMSQVSAFFWTNSYQQFWTKATITPLLQLPKPKGSYFPTNEQGQMTWSAYLILADAREAARKAGFNFEDYDLDVLRFNGPMWRSSANVGYRGAWMLSSDPATTIHEIGHNLGLQHANLWRGTLNGEGANVEYGDEYDLMGSPLHYRTAGFHAINKSMLGWLGASHTREITATGIYRLYAHDAGAPDGSRTFALRVRKDEERDYWIEKRSIIDTSEDMEKSGVLVRWDSWHGSNLGTHLLDPTVELGESLPIGTVLADAEAGIRILPLAQSEDRSHADVAVILGGNRLTLLPGMIHFAGSPGRRYRFESSGDLQNWSQFAEITNLTGDLLVPVPRSGRMQFYRVIEVPDLT